MNKKNTVNSSIIIRICIERDKERERDRKRERERERERERVTRERK